MSEEFTPITSQEQLDSIIGERVKRERETITKKYGDYDDLKKKNTEYAEQIGTATKQIDDFQKTIADLSGKVKGYESHSVKTRIARAAGLPEEFADRLMGEDEDSIRKDAESMAKVFGAQQLAPAASTEQPKGNGEREKLKETLQKLNLSKGE